MTHQENIALCLEHAREDYQHARTMVSATGIRYTRAYIEDKRRRVEKLEAALELSREASGQ